MNDQLKIDDPQVVELLHKLHEGKTDFTEDQLRVLREWADWCLSVEAAKRLARVLRGPSKVIGPFLIAFMLWKAGVLNLNQFLSWAFGHGG